MPVIVLVPTNLLRRFVLLKKNPRKLVANPEYHEIVIGKDHTNHVPGNILDDTRTPRLPKDSLHEMLQQIKHSLKTPR